MAGGQGSGPKGARSNSCIESRFYQLRLAGGQGLVDGCNADGQVVLSRAELGLVQRPGRKVSWTAATARSVLRSCPPELGLGSQQGRKVA